jgi:hypothetical protein
MNLPPSREEWTAGPTILESRYGLDNPRPKGNPIMKPMRKRMPVVHELT